MVLAEALRRGLPLICTTGGAAAETVPDGAGLKVAPARQPRCVRRWGSFSPIPPRGKVLRTGPLRQGRPCRTGRRRRAGSHGFSRP